MTTRWLVRVLVAGLLTTGAPRAAQAPVPRAGGGPHPAPVVIAADQHDVSRPLRQIPPVIAVPGHEREVPLLRRPRGGARRRTLDPVVQNYAGASSMPAASNSFDGVGNVDGVLPPDPNGAIGPDHYVQWVNTSFAIYRRGGASSAPALVYGPAAGNTLWTGFGGPCETRNDGDPIVMYDHLADRWVMSQLATPNAFFGIIQGPFYQCLAISATPDPAGAYYRYQFSFAKLNDYPKLAVWPDAYYMTVNQFQAVSLQWAGQGIVAFDRGRMLAGAAASMVYFDLSSVDMNLGGMLPATVDGQRPPPGSPGYFVQVDDGAWGYSPDQLQLWRLHVDWTEPSASTFTGPSLMPTAAFDSDLCGYSRTCIPQPGTSAKLDALSDRLMYRLQYRNLGDHESLIVNHTVDVDGNDHAGIRWYEIRDPGSAPAIYQQGSYAPDGDDRWMGSAAIDGAGNIALGFSVSGIGTWPSVRYTGRLAADLPGAMTRGEAELVAGGGSQTSSAGRWGDYSMLAIDPIDDCTFWYTQEYYASTSSSGWSTRIGSFAFPSCGASAQPAVSIVASTPTATEAGPGAGAFTVTRTGDTTAPVTIAYTVGGTATPDADYVALPGTVTIPAGSADATIAVTPIDDLNVEANESVVVTLAADPAYRFGVPSEALVTIVSDDQPPDLLVSAVTVPSIGGAGGSIIVTDTTTDQSSAPSAASATGFFLSSDTLLNATDVLLGTRTVPVLAAGGSDTATTTLTVPAGTATGTYYVIAKADVNNTVVETQEANNTRLGVLRIGPDLVISAVTAPSSAAPGGAIAVSDTTANQGGGSADASTTRFYLSANTTVDSGDVLLGRRAVGPLAPGASSAGSVTVTIPPATPAGTYYLLAKADGGGAVSETSEINNVRSSGPVRIGADLVVSALTAPTVAGAGGSIAIADTTANQGTGDAAASTTAFYLSTNAGLDGADTLLGGRAVPALGASASSSGTTSATIPADTPVGTYYLIAKADATGVVPESSDTNNVKITAVRVGPDLVVSTLSGPSSSPAGAAMIVADTTKNQGGGSAAGSATQFHLSANLSLDAGDVLLGSRAVPSLAAGAANSGSTTVTVPSGTAPGSYYLLAVADAANAVVETAETNNLRAIALKITVP